MFFATVFEATSFIVVSRRENSILAFVFKECALERKAVFDVYELIKLHRTPAIPILRVQVIFTVILKQLPRALEIAFSVGAGAGQTLEGLVQNRDNAPTRNLQALRARLAQAHHRTPAPFHRLRER